MPYFNSNVNDHSTWPRLRLCTIAKKSSSDEYGFNLHAERNKGQFVGDVDENSPASIGGLRKGDRIIGINGELSVMDSHTEVIQKIKADIMQCQMLVVDEDGYQWFISNDIPLSVDLPNIDVVDHRKAASDHYSDSKHSELAVDVPQQPSRAAPDDLKTSHTRPGEPDVFIKTSTSMHHQSSFGTPKSRESNRTPKPLLCILMKQSASDEYGFNMHAEKLKGHFIGHVDEDSIAHRSGLVLGQRIVGINGTLIYPDTVHQSVVKLIRSDPLKAELLVAAESVDEYFKEHQLEYSFDNCDVYSILNPPPVYYNRARGPSLSEEHITVKTDHDKSKPNEPHREADVDVSL